MKTRTVNFDAFTSDAISTSEMNYLKGGRTNFPEHENDIIIPPK
jgi:hypothetical protein